MSPSIIKNPPGLAEINYRIGTFTTFRRAMLDKTSLPDLLAGAITSLAQNVGTIDNTVFVLDSSGFPPTPPFRIRIGGEYLLVTATAGLHTWTVARTLPAAHQANDSVILVPVNPFSNWQEGIDGDYQTVFVELWAYLADVLTFYQERIANEAFLGTATQRSSLLRIADLIGYRASPGSAAEGLIAFTAAKNTAVTVPAGFRVRSRAQSGGPAVVFETASAIQVFADNNSIPLASLSPELSYPPNTIVLAGVNHRISVNDLLLAVEFNADDQEAASLLRVTSIAIDKAAGTTTFTWLATNDSYSQASKHVHLHSFDVHASPFGDVAPRFDTLPPGLTTLTDRSFTVPFSVSWDSPLIDAATGSPSAPTAAPASGSAPNPMFFVPPPGDSSANHLYLDSLYPQLQYSQSNPGRAVLVTDGDTFQSFHVVEARETSKAAYAMSGRSTRLTFQEQVDAFTFPLRNTTVLTGSRRLPLQNSLPLSDPLTGAELILSGIHANLQDGQTAILRGNIFDPLLNAPTTRSAAEPMLVDGAPQPDFDNNITVVNLKRPLANQYVRATCTFLANVATITQGETIKDEILGSGDGTAFQSYALKSAPLTYLPATNFDGFSAVDSTLLVTVDGIAWQEQTSLVNSATDDRDYATKIDDFGQTFVRFGDGYTGAKPSTGADNIRATYRKGLGQAGNIAADGIQELVDNLTNLQKATNPTPSGGGDDPANPELIRRLAPNTLRTFGRAVSASDYAALALSFPGIAKASASRMLQDPGTLQAIENPYIQLTAASVDRVPLGSSGLATKLRRFLDTHRDPNIPLRIQDFTPALIAVAVGIDIDPRHPRQATLNRVRGALNAGINPDGSAGFFAFENLSFGQSIFLSSLYAAIQGIDGVADATIRVLRRVGAAADPLSQPPHDIVIRPTEIVVIDDAADSDSGLTITGQGGFNDV